MTKSPVSNMSFIKKYRTRMFLVLFPLDIFPLISRFFELVFCHSGQKDDKFCQNCFEADGDAGHFWTCKAFKEAREKADPDLAAMPPDLIPPPVKQGIAHSMSANRCGIFLGKLERPDGTGDDQWQALGAKNAKGAHDSIRQKIANFDPRVKAREAVQAQLGKKGEQEIPKPQWINEKPPEEPNVCSD